MTTTHTTGPWRVDCRPEDSVCFIFDADSELIAKVYLSNGGFERPSHFVADLLAAAPDLLAALERLLDYEDDEPASDTFGAEVYSAARAAIAKATGKQ